MFGSQLCTLLWDLPTIFILFVIIIAVITHLIGIYILGNLF